MPSSEARRRPAKSFFAVATTSPSRSSTDMRLWRTGIQAGFCCRRYCSKRGRRGVLLPPPPPLLGEGVEVSGVEARGCEAGALGAW